MARAGYVARALVYFVIGYFALLIPFQGGESLDSKEALTKMLYQPFGTVLLFLMGLGLIFYGSWRLIQSIKDTDDHGFSIKGFFVRGGLFISALTHLSLSFRAFQISWAGESSESGGWTGWVLRQPGGQVIVVLISLAFFGVGLAHIYKGYSEGFLKYFKDTPSAFFRNVCKFGLISKGVAFGVIGYLTFHIAINNAQGKKQGLEVALNFIREQSFGWLLIGVMGVGLFSFGMYSALESVYRKVEVS